MCTSTVDDWFVMVVVGISFGSYMNAFGVWVGSMTMRIIKGQYRLVVRTQASHA